MGYKGQQDTCDYTIVELRGLLGGKHMSKEAVIIQCSSALMGEHGILTSHRGGNSNFGKQGRLLKALTASYVVIR